MKVKKKKDVTAAVYILNITEASYWLIFNQMERLHLAAV